MSSLTAPDTSPDAPVPPPPPPRRRPRPALLGAGAVLLFVAAALAAFVLSRPEAGSGRSAGARSVSGPPEAAFRLPVARGWRALDGEALATQPRRPLALVRRRDGSGLIVVRAAGRAPASFEAFSRQLDREFARRLPDFERRTARVVRVRAGRALFYSYIRTRGGTVHSVVLVPSGGRSFVLDSVARGGQPRVAEEIGRMIVAFEA